MTISLTLLLDYLMATSLGRVIGNNLFLSKLAEWKIEDHCSWDTKSLVFSVSISIKWRARIGSHRSRKLSSSFRHMYRILTISSNKYLINMQSTMLWSFTHSLFLAVIMNKDAYIAYHMIFTSLIRDRLTLIFDKSCRFTMLYIYIYIDLLFLTLSCRLLCFVCSL